MGQRADVSAVCRAVLPVSAVLTYINMHFNIYLRLNMANKRLKIRIYDLNDKNKT